MTVPKLTTNAMTKKPKITPTSLNDTTTVLPSDPVKAITISMIIGALSPGQFWGAISAFVILLGASFGSGYQFKSELYRAEIAQTKLELEKSKNQTADLQNYYRGSEAKEKFLILYNRFLGVIEDTYQKPLDSTINTRREEAAKNMALFINQQLEQSKAEKDATSITLPRIKVGHGAKPEQSTITFTGDNTSWLLPKEVVKHVNPNFLTNQDLPKPAAKDKK